MSEMIERNCNKCIHHTSGDCDSWDCKMQTVEDVKKEAVDEYAKAVVEELENNSFITVKNEEVKTKRKDIPSYISVEKEVVLLKDAIEIVKQGGVREDVCEWRLCDEESNVYDTSCRNPHILIEGTPRENNYEFCPYCGKKIKVVE